MYKDSSKRLTGNEVFEGFAVDLIEEVAKILSMILQVTDWVPETRLSGF